MTARIHSAIMNIPCVTPRDANINQQLSFKEGHKQARHQAAELVESKMARLITAAEEWSLYVVEDCAPITLVDYLKEAIK